MAGLPVIFGWGKKGTAIGYLGIDKCPNCKNYVHFSIYEYSNRVNIYFVPVAKFNKKQYLVCPVCEAAWQLEGNTKEEFLEEMLTSPDMDTTEMIWNKAGTIIESNLIEYIEKYKDKWVNKLLEKCAKEIYSDYSDKEEIKKIALKYIKFALDDDKAN